MSNEERLQRISDLKKAWLDLDVPAEEKNRLDGIRKGGSFRGNQA